MAKFLASQINVISFFKIRWGSPLVENPPCANAPPMIRINTPLIDICDPLFVYINLRRKGITY